MPRLLARLGVLLAVSFGLIVGTGSVAGAHVTVHSDDAVQGGHAEIAFRVPNESDTASTVKLQVAFPTDLPIASVSVLPHPGWTYRVGKRTDAVSEIEWNAVGPDTAVKPGEYEVFRIVAGPLPTTDRLVFKVVQTYADGEVVRWIDEPVTNGPEPEHPAPVLVIAAGGSADAVAHAGHTVAASASAGGAPSSATFRVLAVTTTVAVLVALLAVVLAMRTARRGRGDEAPA